jgi:zinc D-Ala-D-Ala dipeptidase
MPNNLINRHNILQGPLLFFFTTLCSFAFSQEKQYIKPSITDDWDEYEAAVKTDSTQKMVELKKLNSTIMYDLRYATVNNFMRRLMYPAGTKETYLRLLPAHALNRVQSELNLIGHGLKIYDAYRPYAVTEKFWELKMKDMWHLLQKGVATTGVLQLTLRSLI